MADFFPATLVERLGWTLVHSVWQFVLIALVAQAAARSLRGASPSLRHGVFLVALAAMLLSSLLTVSLVSTPMADAPIARLETRAAPLVSVGGTPPAVPTAPEPARASAAVPLSEPTLPEPIPVPVPQQPWWLVATESLRPWLDECVWVWCFGVLLFAVRPLLGWWTIQRLRTIGVSPVSAETQQLLERTSRRLGLRQVVRILQSTLVNAPVVIGDWRPLILLPVTFATELPAAQVESILAHELAHIRRHDFLVNVCQTVVETLFFYHPAVWWVSSRLRIERENCCDDLAVEALGNRVEYGRALLAVAQFRGARPTLALGVADASLLSRVRRILGLKVDNSGRRYAVGPWPAAVGVLSLLVSGGLLSMAWNVAAQEDVKPVARFSADVDAGEHKANSTKLPNGVTVTLAGITKNTAPSSAGWRPDGGPMEDVAEWPKGLTLHDGNTVSRRDPKTVKVDDDAIDFLFEFGDLSVPPSLRFELPANGGSYSKDPIADPYRLRVSARKRDPAKLPPGATFSTPDGRVRVGYTDEPWGKWVKISPTGNILNPPQESDRHAGSYRQVTLLRAGQTLVFGEVRADDGPSRRDPALWSVVLQSPAERSELFDFQITGVDDRGQEHWVLALQSKRNDKSRTEEEWVLAQALPEGRTLSYFAYRLRPYRYWVTFNNVALEPGANQEVSVEVTEVPGGKPETDPPRNEPAKPAADEAQATAPASTGLELRLVANLPDSKAKPTVPEDWATRHYRDGRDENLEAVKDRGFAWFPIAGKELTVPEISVPIEGTVGKERLGLLGDIHDSAMLHDDSWHVLACTPEESANGTWSVRITLDRAGAERLAELTKTHLNQKLAIVVDRAIVAAPVIRNELGAQVEITGNFTKADAERMAAAIRREIFKPFDCEIVDATTNKPIPGDGFTIHFLFKTPATADKPEETIDNVIWGPKSRSQFYFAIPKRTLRHPDRDRMIVHWGVSHPDYKTLSDQKSAPLGQILRDDPKSARDQFRRIVMQPKKRAVEIEAPDGSKLEADTLRVSSPRSTTRTEEAPPPQRPMTDAEKAIAKVVLVFFQDQSRRAIPAVLVKGTARTWVVAAGPATVVPDGTAKAIDGTFLELSGKPPIRLGGGKSTIELEVYSAPAGLTEFNIADAMTLAVGDALSTVSHDTIDSFKVTPNAAHVTALNQESELKLESGAHHHYKNLVRVDRVLPEGTPLFKDGKLAGLTLLGRRFLGEAAGKSYVVPVDRIAALCAELEKPADDKAPADAGARLKIEYDIPGQEPEVRLYIQRVGSEQIGPVQEGGSRWTPLKNGATLDLKDLPEGVYHIARTRQVEVARAGTSAMHRILYIDRRIVELKSGQTQEIQFTRPTGRTVKGRIANLKDLKRDRALVRIVADESEGAASPKALTREKMLDPDMSKRERILDELKHPLFDARGCDAEGNFETEPLPPGKYVAVAEAYEITEERLRLSGIILPRWVGLARFEVPAKGEVPAFEVTLDDAERQAANAQDNKAKVAASEAEVYKNARELEAMQGWVIAWDLQNPISHSDGKRMAKLRVFSDGRVVALQGVRDPLAEIQIPKEEVTRLVSWLVDDQKATERPMIRVAPESRTGQPEVPEKVGIDPLLGPHWDQHLSRVAIQRGSVTYDLLLVTSGPDGAVLAAQFQKAVAPLSPEVQKRLQRLMSLAVAGGDEAVARHAKLADDELRLRHPKTPLRVQPDSIRGAGFDSDGTRAIYFEFRGEAAYPTGEIVVRVPPAGEPFVDDARYRMSESQVDQWGRANDKSRNR